jgi:hypothetical protein
MAQLEEHLFSLTWLLQNLNLLAVDRSLNLADCCLETSVLAILWLSQHSGGLISEGTSEEREGKDLK